MEEVTGPVIAIAIILSAVFIPTAFIPGITGRLYQQFAVTIAVSVIISAFNALTLSPALSALLLRPKKKSTGLLQKFFDWFNKWFGRATDGYVGVCRFLIHKSAFALLLLVGAMVLAGLLGKSIPTSFLPDEDQGYVFAGVQLPDAASLQRTDEVVQAGGGDPQEHAGREVLLVGRRLQHVERRAEHLQRLLLHHASRNGRKRKKPEEQYKAIKAHLNREFGKIPGAIGFAFPPPAIPGRRHLGRRHLRAGGPLRQGHRVPGGRTCKNSWRRRRSARSWPASSPPRCRPCRRCSWTWTATRCSSRA